MCASLAERPERRAAAPSRAQRSRDALETSRERTRDRRAARGAREKYTLYPESRYGYFINRRCK